MTLCFLHKNTSKARINLIKTLAHCTALLLIILSGFFIGDLRTNNNMLDWLPKEHPQVQKVLHERKDGNLTRTLLLGIESSEHFAQDQNLARLIQIETWLKDSTSAYSVKGLSHLIQKVQISNSELQDLSAMQIVQTLFDSQPKHSPFWSDDGKKVFISVELLGKGDSLDDLESEIVEQIESQITQGHFPKDTHLAGFGVISKTLNNLVLTKGLGILGITYIVLSILLTLSLRNFRNLGVASVVLTLSSLTTHGLMAMLGIPLNLMTIAVGTLVLILGIADILHISKHLESQPNSKLKAVFWPCFWTSMTTAVGFLSLKLSGLAILDQFGTACTLGIVSTLFWSFYVYNLAQNFAFSNKNPKLTSNKPGNSGIYSAYSKWILTNIKSVKWLLPLSTLVLLAAVFVGFPKLKVDTNLLDYLPQDGKVVADNQWFSEAKMGVNRVHLDLQKSILTPLEIENILLEKNYKDFFWINQDSQKLLSVASPHNASSNELSLWQSKLSSLDFGGTQAEIGGFPSLFALIFDELLSTQIKSGLSSFILILLMLALILRKTKWIIVGILANSLPLLAILALLIYTGIGIDITTVCVTILTLGIVVDDTIHLLWNMNKCEQNKDAQGLVSVVGAISSTSIILGVGFAFLAFSSILSLHLFGLILALGIVVAWIFDLLLIPWCYPNLERDLK